MFVCRSALGGPTWDHLEIEATDPSRATLGPLQWQELLPLLEQVRGDVPKVDHSARLACIYAQVLGDVDKAWRHLCSAPATPQKPWLMLWLALSNPTDSALKKRLADARAATSDAGEQVMLEVLESFIRHRFLGESLEAPTSNLSHAGSRLVHQLPLAHEERWAELVPLLVAGSSDRLAAAHVLGDRLDRHDEQSRILLDTDPADLQTADILLELALRGQSSEPTSAALSRRRDILQSISKARAAATQVPLQLSETPTEPLPSLDPPAALEAWNHLRLLWERIRTITPTAPPQQVAECYLAEANQEGEKGDWLAIRAYELFATVDRDRAKSLLKDRQWSDGLQPCVLRYLMLEEVQDGDWPAAAHCLARIAHRVDDVDRSLLMQTALLAAWDDLDLVTSLGGEVLEWVADTGINPTNPVTAVLVAAMGRTGAEKIAETWSRLLDLGRPSSETALFGFVVGLIKMTSVQADRAMVAFQIDRELVGDTPTNLAGVAALLAKKEGWSHVINTLDRLAGMLEPEAAATLHRLAGHVAAVQIQDTGLALSLLDKALEHQHDNTEILADRAALRLRAGGHEHAVTDLRRLADLETDDTRRADILCAAGQLTWENLKDPAAAETLLRRAIEVAPSHQRSLNHLARLLKQVGRDRELAETLSLLLEGTRPDDRQALQLDLAGLHITLWEEETDPADTDRCITLAQEVLQQDPHQPVALRLLVAGCTAAGKWTNLLQQIPPETSDPVVLKGLCAACRETEQWQALVTANDRLLTVEKDPTELRLLLQENGLVSAQHLQDLDASERFFRRAVERFQSLEALECLVDLLVAQDRTKDMLAVLEHKVELLPVPDRRPVHLRLGQLYREREDSQAAMRHYLAAVTQDPTDLATLRILEELQTEGQHNADLARTLEQIYTLVEKGTSTELELLFKLGRVYEELKDDRSLLRMAVRAQRHHLECDEGFNFIKTVLLRQNRHTDLCELYNSRIEMLESRPEEMKELLGLLRQKGHHELTHLKDLTAAADTMTRVLELDPEDRETLGHLERLLMETSEWQRLASVYEKRANHLTDRDDQLASLRKAAQIAVQMFDDVAESERLYERIYAISPTDKEAFTFLERKLERKKDYDTLINMLLDRAERPSSPEELVECLVRAAALCERVERVEQSTELYKKVLDLNPANIAALDALERIYETKEIWEDFLQVIWQHIHVEQDAGPKALLYFKYGSVLETKFQRNDEAEQAYRKAVRISPRCIPALHSLRELYNRRGDWKRVVETLETECKLWKEDKGKAAVLAQMAAVYGGKLSDESRALEHYKRALEIDPKNMPAALALFEAHAKSGYLKEATQWGRVYADEVRMRGSLDQRATFFVKWSQVLRQVGSTEDAADVLIRALRSKKPNHAAERELVSLCREAPDCYDFADLFTEMLRDASTRGDNLSTALASFGLGSLSEQRRDIPNARRHYQQALEIGGFSLEFARPLADLLLHTGREGAAVDLVQKCRSQSEDSFNEWMNATIWLVDYHLIWNNDHVVAMRLCQEVLDQQPNAVRIRERLSVALTLAGDLEEAKKQAQMLLRQATARGMSLARGHFRLGGAQIRLGDTAEARSSWQTASENAPAWELPYIEQFRVALTEKEHQRALGVVDSARTHLGEEHPTVLRLRAMLYTSGGQMEKALNTYGALLAGSTATNVDQVLVARLLHQGGKSGESIQLLRSLVHKKLLYLPAVEELERVSAAEGDQDLAFRARQLVILAEGGSSPSPANLPKQPLPSQLWTRLIVGINEHPIQPVWQLLREAILADTEPVLFGPLEEGSTQELVAQLGRILGAQVRVHLAPKIKRLWTVGEGDTLMLSPQFVDLPLPLRRFVLAKILTMFHTGHNALFALREADRERVVKGLGQLVVKLPAPGMATIIDRLPGRKQRQLSKLLVGPPPGMDAPDISKSWLDVVEAMALKTALLVTNDIVSLTQLVAFEHRIQNIDDDPTGLVSVVDGLGPVVEHFLSEGFGGMRAELS